MEPVPFAVSGLDFDNGREFLNHAVIKWAADLEIFFTRSRPYIRGTTCLSGHAPRCLWNMPLEQVLVNDGWQAPAASRAPTFLFPDRDLAKVRLSCSHQRNSSQLMNSDPLSESMLGMIVNGKHVVASWIAANTHFWALASPIWSRSIWSRGR